MKLFDVYPLFDVNPKHATGHYVYDSDGKEYIDFYGGHAVISIGHSHPHYTKIIKTQLEQIGFYSNSVQNSLQIELAEKLGNLSRCDDYRLFLSNSGAEANENALKLASFKTGKTKVLAFHNGFHGRTSAAVNTTDNARIQAPINKGTETTFVNLNDIETVVQELAKGDYAAVIIEGIQGIAGIYEPTDDFLIQLREECHRHQVVLILDEIQSGYGRSGHFFAYQKSGIKPDIITSAKGMGNGFPIAATLISSDFEASYGLLGTTFGGNHLACAAGIAVLDVIKNEDLLNNANQVGGYLISLLKKLPHLKEIRGRGLMVGIEFDFPIKTLRKKLVQEQCLFTGSSKNPNTLRLLPALNIDHNLCDMVVDKIAQTIKAL